jgi:hypothetical protein
MTCSVFLVLYDPYGTVFFALDTYVAQGCQIFLNHYTKIMRFWFENKPSGSPDVAWVDLMNFNASCNVCEIRWINFLP